MRDKAVVLLSGGMDSLVAAAVAAQDHELALLHASYGQRAREREIVSFERISAHYGVKERLKVDLPVLGQIGGSSLTDIGIPVPEGTAEEAIGSLIPSTYVPFRNAHLLACGVSWAEVIGARAVFIGANELDSSGYPDCRESFLSAFQAAVDEGTRPGSSIRLAAPLINLNKAGIVALGAKLNAPFELTWSCYQPGPKACGRCESCLLRLKGFREAGIPDPLPYLP